MGRLAQRVHLEETVSLEGREIGDILEIWGSEDHVAPKEIGAEQEKEGMQALPGQLAYGVRKAEEAPREPLDLEDGGAAKERVDSVALMDEMV